jgi:hypothetical protein
MKASDVFVPGGQPVVTYVSRAELNLESKLRDYLQEGNRILSVAGPTKSGKTVLIKNVVTNPCLMAGGNIHSLDDFWSSVADHLGAFATETKEKTGGESVTRERQATIGVDVVVHAKAGAANTGESSTGKRQALSRTRNDENLAIERLLELRRTLVIDDFHYLTPDLQRDIVRGLKQPVYDGLRVIISAVPHRSSDAVRAEKEMTGRVEHLRIPPWDPFELQAISTTGFHNLNVVLDLHEQARLAVESFGSPHLMQDFCLQLCKIKNVREEQKTAISLNPFTAYEWERFFRLRAQNMSSAAFESLLSGPTRDNPKPYELADGEKTDAYGVVLRAIAKTGPAAELTLPQITAALKAFAPDSTIPNRAEVRRILKRITKIAKQQLGAELAFEFDATSDRVFISDPFFAFLLRWGDDHQRPASFDLPPIKGEKGGSGFLF